MADPMPRAWALNAKGGAEGGGDAGDAMVTTGYISVLMLCHEI